MNSSKIRIGIVGAGSIVRQRHVPGLAKIPDVEIKAVCNSSRESSERFCAETGLRCRVFARWEELVAWEELDAIWIGATPYLHAPVSLAALAAGRHVFCQARMARNLPEGLQMLRASLERPDLATMLCPPPFGLETDSFATQLFASPPIGTLRRLRLCSLNAGWRNAELPAHWRQKREISGNNVLSLGIFVEILQRWFGDICALSAKGKIVIPNRQGYEVTVPDELEVLAEFSSGMLGSLSFSGVHEGPPQNTLEVEGDDGRILWNADQETFFQYSREGTPTTLLPPTESLRPWRVEEDFIDAVRGTSGVPPRPGFSEGIAYMRVVDGVHEALKTGSRQVLTTPNCSNVSSL